MISLSGASLVGDLYSIDVPLGFYRIHGHNAWFKADRRKPKAFTDALDCYLNRILVHSGRQPVMSFGDSMESWTDMALEGRWIALIGHIARLSVAQHDVATARFAYRALRLAILGQSETERSEAGLL